MTIYEKVIEYLTPERFTSLGTTQFSYTNGDGEEIYVRFSVTFLLGSKGSRDIGVDYDKEKADRLLCTYRNHKYYHSTIIPFLNKTGWGTCEGDDLIKCIDKVCDQHTEIPKKKVINTHKKEDNVIFSDFTPDKS